MSFRYLHNSSPRQSFEKIVEASLQSIIQRHFNRLEKDCESIYESVIVILMIEYP